MTPAILAADIGGTKINLALVDPTATPAHLHDVQTCPTPAHEGPSAVLEAVAHLGRKALETAGLTACDAVGIATAGIVDQATGTITHATDSIRGWAGTPVAKFVADTFGAPCSVLNDVHAHGLGETMHGTGRDLPSLLMVAVGTGIGGALITGGEVATGTHGLTGHIGHVPCAEATGAPCTCGREGHLEGFASGPGIAAAYARHAGLPIGSVETRDVAARAADGEETAAEVLTAAGFATGRIIGGLLNTFDPAAVAITGGVTATGPIWWQALRAGVRHDAMDPVSTTPVREATAGNHAALLGAAHQASATLT